MEAVLTLPLVGCTGGGWDLETQRIFVVLSDVMDALLTQRVTFAMIAAVHRLVQLLRQSQYLRLLCACSLSVNAGLAGVNGSCPPRQQDPIPWHPGHELAQVTLPIREGKLVVVQQGVLTVRLQRDFPRNGRLSSRTSEDVRYRNALGHHYLQLQRCMQRARHLRRQLQRCMHV